MLEYPVVETSGVDLLFDPVFQTSLLEETIAAKAMLAEAPFMPGALTPGTGWLAIARDFICSEQYP